MTNGNIRIPAWLATIIVSSGVCWLAWMSNQIHILSKDMSAVKEHLHITTEADSKFWDMKLGSKD